jgi:hypothetical protein
MVIKEKVNLIRQLPKKKGNVKFPGKTDISDFERWLLVKNKA